MSTNEQRPPDVEAHEASPGGLNFSITGNGVRHSPTEDETASPALEAEALTLGSLPVGARLILRCRADWRTATVAAVEAERVVLNVASPTGHTYRVRRPHDAALRFDGHVPVLGEGCWRAGLARYDVRW